MAWLMAYGIAQVVVDRAASVLHFLQDNCKKYSLGPYLPFAA
jgi:hypothetical protein